MLHTRRVVAAAVIGGDLHMLMCLAIEDVGGCGEHKDSSRNGATFPNSSRADVAISHRLACSLLVRLEMRIVSDQRKVV